MKPTIEQILIQQQKFAYEIVYKKDDNKPLGRAGKILYALSVMLLKKIKEKNITYDCLHNQFCDKQTINMECKSKVGCNFKIES